MAMDEKELNQKIKDGRCICDACARRFICWTQKRAFSEPAYQSLYEVHIQEGKSHEEAIAQVRSFVEHECSTAIQIAERGKRAEVKDCWVKERKLHPSYSKQDRWVYDKLSSVRDSTRSVDEFKKEITDLKKKMRKAFYGKDA